MADFFSIFNKDNSKELYLKYTKVPDKVYTQQRFSVKLEAIILTPNDEFDNIITTYSNEHNIEIVDPNIDWIFTSENTYTTKIIYKSKKGKLTLPTITVSLLKDKEIIKSISLESPKIKYSKIALNQEKFSSIIAKNIIIHSVKSKQYSNSMLMVVINMSTKSGNLEEFHLKQFDEQAIQSFEEINGVQNIYYYVIVPTHIQNIQFNYYNPIEKEFIDVELPIILDDELVSTQTDLNPNNSNLLLYKQISLLIMLIVLSLIYIKTKNKIFVILTLIIVFFLIKISLPNERRYIQKDTKIYILPSASSTIYKVLEDQSNVEVLMQRDGFMKVLFQDKTIGWIKE